MEDVALLENSGRTKVSRKEEILRSATHLFRERGYSSSSVRDLAQEVGIEAPSIYSHFKSKEHILNHICFEMARAFMGGMEVAEKEQNASKKMICAIKEHIRVISQYNEASAVMWNEWKFLTNPSLDQFHGMIKDYEQRFESIIVAGMEEGYFKTQDASVVTNLILASLNSLAYWNRMNHKSDEGLENQIIELFVNGLNK